MKPEAQRIAIAEACGWRLAAQPPKYAIVVVNPDGYEIAWGHLNGRTPDQLKFDFAHNLPDYLNSLDAMHEAEKVLDDFHHHNFRQQLHQACGHNGRSIYSATAAQRAEAFLRTRNLWTE